MDSNKEGGSSSSSAELEYMQRRIGVLLSMRQYHHPLVKLDEEALDMAELVLGCRMKLHQHPRWRTSSEDLQLLASGWFDRLRR